MPTTFSRTPLTLFGFGRTFSSIFFSRQKNISGRHTFLLYAQFLMKSISYILNYTQGYDTIICRANLSPGTHSLTKMQILHKTNNFSNNLSSKCHADFVRKYPREVHQRGCLYSMISMLAESSKDERERQLINKLENFSLFFGFVAYLKSTLLFTVQSFDELLQTFLYMPHMF